MQEHAARGLVDVLGHRDELGSGLADGKCDLHVVPAVAGKAVDLVDDDVVRVSLLSQPSQHLLEFGAVGLAGRLSGVDVDVEHIGAELFGLLDASVLLCADREPFAVPIRVDLANRRHSEVDHRGRSLGALLHLLLLVLWCSFLIDPSSSLLMFLT